MSQAGSQAALFYKEVEATRKLWTMKDDDGYPAPIVAGGKRSMPFWSSRSRVERIIKNVPAYKGFVPEEVDLEEFYNYWLTENEKDRYLIGINWSGPRAVGYDVEPHTLKTWIDHFRSLGTPS